MILPLSTARNRRKVFSELISDVLKPIPLHDRFLALMNVFFALTLFLSAFLVFSCEPTIGKMLLPYLGGAPSVWTTCVLFFQTMLLAGYAYAYMIERAGRLRTQLV